MKIAGILPAAGCRLIARTYLSFILVAQQLVLAGPVQAYTGPSSQSAPLHHGLNLNSTNAYRSAGQMLNHFNVSNANLTVGNSVMSVTPATKLTSAEMVALHQVLRTGTQSLQLGSLGNATGGAFVLNSRLAAMINHLVIPSGVTAIEWVGSRSSTITLSGNLRDYGSLYIVSANPTVTALNLTANNITVAPGAVLSSVIPAGGLPLLSASIQSALHSLDLNLVAQTNFSNAGTVSSSGNLSVTAGGTITNALPSGTLAAAPVMQAAQNLWLSAGSGNFTNSGLIASLAGNINITTPSPADIAINATGGSFQAANGNINVRDAGFSQSNNLTMTGGDFVSNQLNLYTGTGNVSASLNSASGTINTYAGSSMVQTAGGTLALGQVDVTGDPIFCDTGGPVLINSALRFNGDDLVVMASTNIVTQGGSINTSGASATSPNGGNILLLAGATISPATDNLNSGGTSGAGGNLTTLFTIKGADSTGGYIDLTGGTGAGGGNSPITSFTSSGFSTGTGNAGNITMIAYGGSASFSGTINLPTGLTVNAQGTNGGANGNITIIAGSTASTKNASTIGAINASGGGSGGSVTVATLNPLLTAASYTLQGNSTGTTVTGINSIPITLSGAAGSGTITTGNITAASQNFNFGTGTVTTLATSTNSFSTVSNSSGNYTLNIGSSVQNLSATTNGTNSVTVSGNLGNANMQTVTLNAGGSVTVGSAGSITAATAATLKAASNAAVSINGNVSAPLLTFIGSSFTNSASIVADTASGQGGAITVENTAGALTVSSFGPTFSVAPTGTSSGGSITISATGALSVPAATLAANAGGGNSNGGAVSLSGSAISVTGSGTLSLQANASGTGSGGSINISGPLTFSGGNVSLSATGSGGAVSTGNLLLYNSATGGNATISAGGAITTGNILSNGASVTLQSSNGSVTAGGIDVSGAGGAPSSTGPGNGQNGGTITISALTNISTGYLQAYGGGGSGGNGALANAAAGTGGNGGAVSVTSSQGSITISGDVNTSGGGGGGSDSSIAQVSGGNAGNISISTSTASPSAIVSITGPLLAAGGGCGANCLTGSGGDKGGGGSFGGGGGGATYSAGTGSGVAGNGGGGFYGGGGGGSGGGGLAIAGAGGGFFGGGAGGAGEGSTGKGSNGSAGNGGNGANNASGPSPDGTFGSGGFSSSGFGMGGNVGDTGSASSGNITVQGYSVGINGSVGSALSYSGTFTGYSVYGGNVVITTYSTPAAVASQNYFADANLANGAATYAAAITGGSSFTVGSNSASNTNGIYGSLFSASAGNINSAAISGAVNSGTFGGGVAITVAGNAVNITNGALVTPAEWIAAIQVSDTGIQSLTLSGTGFNGYATGGSFTVAAANMPATKGGNFSSLSLPAGVTENINTSSVTYSAAGTVAGTMSANTDLSLTFAGLTVASSGTISAAGNLSINTASLANAGTLASQPASGQAGNLTIANSGGNLSVTSFGTINIAPSAPGGGSGGTITFSAAGALALPAATLAANATGSNFNGGSILLSGSSISVSGAGQLSLQANAAGYGNGGTISVSGPLTFTGGNVSFSASGIGGSVSTGDLLLFSSAAGTTGGNAAVTAGGAITTGNILSNSATVTLQSAAGAITTGGIDVSGAGGLPTTGSSLAGTAGANGGSISLNAPGNIATGFLRAYGGGGAGGNNNFNAAGGAGGNGGTISVSSSAGNITINGDINASGGGGGGFDSAGAGTSAGGNGGDVTIAANISANAVLTISGPVLVAAGGSGGTDKGGGGSFGGGGGGASYSCCNGPGGGGGGGFFGGGGGGSGATAIAGAGGGFFGGGAGGSGNAGSATNGFAGNGGDGGNNSGSGGSFGAGGLSAECNCAGGNAGTGGSNGNISLQGYFVAVNGTAASTLGYGGSSNAYSAYGGNVTITTATTPGVVSNQNYFADANLSNGANTYAAAISGGGSSFTVGTNSASNTNGTYGSIYSASTGSINTVPVSGTVNSGAYGGNLAITVAGNTVYITDGNLITPAEWIAAIQVSDTGIQSLTLSGSGFNGYATGGSFTVGSGNMPATNGGNFANLNLPSGTTENITSSSVTYTGSAVVNGTVASASSLSFSANSLTVGSGASLSASGNLAVNIGSVVNNGTISSAAGQLQLSNASGLTITGAGTMSAPAGVSFASSAGSVSITQGVLSNTVSGNAGGDFSVQTTASDLLLGAITAGGNLTANSSGNLTTSGATSSGSNMSLTSGGDMNLGGNLTAGTLSANAGTTLETTGALTVTSATMQSGSTMNIGGSVTAANNLQLNSGADLMLTGNVSADTVTATTQSNGNITFATNSAMTASSITITANGSGNIDETASGSSISAATLILQSGTGYITTPGVTASNVSANSSGDVTISDNATAVVLGSSTGNNFLFTSTFDGGSVEVSGSISGATSTALTTTGCSAMLTVDAGSAITAGSSGTSGTLTLDTNNLYNYATISAEGPAGNTFITCSTCTSVGLSVLNNGAISATGTTNVSGAGSLTVTGTGSITGNSGIQLNGSGAVLVSQAAFTGAVSGSGTSFTATSGSSLVVGDVTATAASVSLSSTAALTDNGNVTAASGSITMMTTGTSSDDISINGNLTAQSVTLSAGGSGNINQSSGTLINAPTLTASSGTGDIGSSLNNVTTDAAVYTIMTNGSAYITDNGTWSVGGSSFVGQTLAIDNAALLTAGQPVNPLLNSLDLTNPSTVQNLFALQFDHYAGGQLAVTGNWASIQGTATVTPGVLTATIAADNIPANVTMTLQNFQSTPLNINLTGSSSTQQVVISGTQQFASASATVNITSNQQSPVLLVNAGGLLSASGTLNINAGSGSVQLNAGSSLTAASLNVQTSSLSNAGSITATANSGSININSLGALTVLGANGTMAATGSGANTLSFNASGANALTLSGAQILNAGSSGSVAFNSQASGGSVVLSTSALETVGSGNVTFNTGMLNNSGTLSASSNVSVQNSTSGALTIANNGSLIAGAVLAINSTAAISVSGTGILTSGSGTTATSSSSVNVCQSTINGTIGGSAATTFTAGTTAGSLTLGSITAAAINVASGGGNLNVSAGAVINQTADKTTFRLAGDNVTIGDGALVESYSIRVKAESVINDGTLQATGSKGSVSFSSAAATSRSCCRIVPFGGASSMTIENDGSIVSPAGIAFSGNTTLDNTNNGMILTSGNMRFTTLYGGALTITNSGELQSSGGNIRFNGANGAIALNNSGEIIADKQVIFSSNNGNLAVTNSGVVNSQNGDLTMTNAGTGALSISNNGTLSSSKNISMSDSGAGIIITGSGNLDAGNKIVASLSNSGLVNVTQANIAGIVESTGSGGTSFSLASTNSGLTVGNVSANMGSVTIVAGAGNLTVENGASITAFEGNITLQDLNTSSGNITIGSNAHLFAYTHSASTGLGNIYVAIGGIPTNPVAGTTPANVKVTTSNGGYVYFGTNSITATKRVTLDALGSNIVFSTGSRPASAITLDNGVNMLADPPALGSAATPAAIYHPATSSQSPATTLISPALLHLGLPAAPITNADIVPRTPDENSSVIPLQSIYSSHRDSSDGSSRYPLDITDKQVDEMTDEPALKQVSFTPPSAAAIPAIHQVSTLVAGDSLIKHAGHARVNIDEKTGAITLNRGEILVVAKTDHAVVKTGDYSITVQPGAIALIRSYDGVLKVRNLCDSSHHGVSVCLGNSMVNLSVAEELVSGPDTNLVRTAMSVDRVSRRGTKSYTGNLDHNFVNGEVSLVSLMSNSAVLSHLLFSQTREDKAIGARLTKMAACLHSVTQVHGPYAPVSP